MGIKSSLSVAGNVSVSLSKAATALNTIQGSTNVASRTNVTGNNIHSVAKDFSQIDQHASQQFQLNRSPMSRWMK